MIECIFIIWGNEMLILKLVVEKVLFVFCFVIGLIVFIGVEFDLSVLVLLIVVLGILLLGWVWFNMFKVWVLLFYFCLKF